MSRVLLTIMLCGYPAVVWGYPWDQDMVDQPSAKAQESVAPAEPDAIPVGGTETLPTPTSEAEIFDAKDAAAGIPNPVAASAESIARGQYFYQINCLVCHGEKGLGDGPVGLKFEDPTPVDLNDEYTQDQTDGQIFFTITRGRVAMPFYRDALSREERWDLINYLRHEFGKQ
jgi:mono/diheme cytochrome c family protein